MTDRMLDPSIRRSANEAWYVSGRASQQDRYARCMRMLLSRMPRPGLVYDVGAGTGHFARMLAGRARIVVGVERMLERVELCRSSHADLANLQFVQGDFLEIDIPEKSADAVCALEMLYYVEPRKWSRFLDKIFRTLKPGGMLLASLNVFTGDGAERERSLLQAIAKRFQTLEAQHMYRMHYYRLELPLIRLLDEIVYLEHVKVFYPHTLSVEHVVYSPRLDRLLLPPSWLLDRMLLPACRRLALIILGSRALYRLITETSRLLAPRASRSQTIMLAQRPAGEAAGDDGAGDGHGARHPG